jgi:hypothetical protein
MLGDVLMLGICRTIRQRDVAKEVVGLAHPL